MKIFPAIDLYNGKAVRLFRGDYAQMTVYSERPWEVACDFEKQGASAVHLVDLEGAKDGTTPALSVVRRIKECTRLFIEIGGGIRTMEAVDAYFSIGVDRVILGTAAVNDRKFLTAAIKKYGNRIAVGVDVKNDRVAIKGWTETTEYTTLDFCREMQSLGIKNIICTDISKDGAMQGTNHDLYRKLSADLSLDITASGGVSTMDDIRRLAGLGLYGAIIGKAYYTGAIALSEAIEVAEK